MGKSSQTVGYILAFTQAVLYASMGIVCKAMQELGATSEQVTLLRFSTTIVILGAFLLISRKQRILSRNPLLYVAAIFFFLSAYPYYVGVKMLTAGMATVLYFTYPAVTAILGVFLFKERLTARIIFVVLLNLVGVFFISEVYLPGNTVMDPIGILMVLIASTSYAGYTIMLQVINDRKKGQPDSASPAEGPFTITFCVSAISLIISGIVFWDQVPSLPSLSLSIWGLALFMCLFNTIIPIVLYALAVERIGGTKASLIAVAEAPVSLILCFLILGEVISLGQAFGSALIVLAVLVITMESQKKAA